jgi:hypothetical protein
MSDQKPNNGGIVFVSFFTAAYRNEAVTLAASLRKLDLRYEIQSKHFPGLEWQQVCQRKIDYILGMMEYFPGSWICWLDADGILVKAPLELERLARSGGYDFAAHRFPGGTYHGGVMLFAPNERTKELLRVAEKWCMNHDRATDLEAISSALRLPSNRARFYPLPPEYAVVPRVAKLTNPKADDPTYLHKMKRSVSSR